MRFLHHASQKTLKTIVNYKFIKLTKNNVLVNILKLYDIYYLYVIAQLRIFVLFIKERIRVSSR